MAIVYSRMSRLPSLLACVLVVALYVWTAANYLKPFQTSHTNGFYGMLTEAFTSGQLHLHRVPDPRLAKLENPWAGAQDVPRLHDATYYHGKYYLYFGTAPVFLVYAPVRLLANTYLSDGAGTIIFSILGFLLSVRLWLRLRNHFFPRISSWTTASTILLLGLGNFIYFVLQAASFYQVPIACAYACFFAALNAVEMALSAISPQRTITWLSLAALGWSMAIAARPNYLFTLPLLVLPLYSILSRANKLGWAKSQSLRAAVVTFFPPLVVGAYLAWYNYSRFGSVGEFGVRYQFAASDQRNLQLTSLNHLWDNLWTYLFAAPHISIYFPFVLQPGDQLGLLTWAPFAIFAPLVLDPTTKAQFGENGERGNITSICLVLSGLLTLGSLCLLPFSNDRYLGDCAPALILAALVASFALYYRLRNSSPWSARAFSVVAGASALWTVFCGLCLGWQNFPSLQIRDSIAKASNHGAPLLEALFRRPSGAIEMDLSFPEFVAEQREPLVVSGFGRDMVYVHYLDASRLKIGFFHTGAGGPESRVIKYQPGKKYRLHVDLGSLYPPPQHPVFSQWPSPLVAALRRRAEVSLDGVQVIHWMSDFYPSDPVETKIGRNDSGIHTKKYFGGRVENVTRTGIPDSSSIATLKGSGPVRLNLKFPRFRNIYSEPLLSTGHTGAGDLIYITYLGENRAKLGHDSWGFGSMETAEFEYDPGIEHHVDIDFGSLEENAPGGKFAPFKIRFDGKLLVTTERNYNPSSPYELTPGVNTVQSSVAQNMFTGEKLEAERIPRF